MNEVSFSKEEYFSWKQNNITKALFIFLNNLAEENKNLIWNKKWLDSDIGQFKANYYTGRYDLLKELLEKFEFEITEE